MKQLSKNTIAFIDALGERNASLIAWRHVQRLEERDLALQVNHTWFERMWATPDMAMCLGRYKSAKQERKHNGKGR